MELRGIEFGTVLGASGVNGFFGEGYWFHPYLKLFGLNFKGMTFVAKTATCYPRAGNMPLTDKYTPLDRFPACIKVQAKREIMLNAVGLSNPGLNVLLQEFRWQERDDPFFLSLMAIGDTPEDRFAEMRQMVAMLCEAKPRFSAPFGVQINLSCPNTSHAPKDLIGEAAAMLDIASELNVPLMPKFSIASAPIAAVRELQDHPACDAICVSNTIPFGWPGINWDHVWGSKTSPLQHYGGGGLSGSVLRPLVCAWITELRAAGFTKAINGGGGILKPRDVDDYVVAGANSVFIGSVASLHPTRVKRIINYANNVIGWEKTR